MERPVKERLVGATILVALIVLIVPELLSGPKRPAMPSPSTSLPAPTRTVSVDLTTNKTTPAPQAGDLASAASAASSGAAASDVAPGGDAAGASAASAAPPTVSTLRAQALSAPTLETLAPTPKSAAETEKLASQEGSRAWTVQLGSFVSRANAEKLVHQLKATGSVVYVTSSGSGRSVRYRVRTGPLPDRAAAERAAAKLKAAGHTVTIVTPAP